MSYSVHLSLKTSSTTVFLFRVLLWLVPEATDTFCIAIPKTARFWLFQSLKYVWWCQFFGTWLLRGQICQHPSEADRQWHSQIFSSGFQKKTLRGLEIFHHVSQAPAPSMSIKTESVHAYPRGHWAALVPKTKRSKDDKTCYNIKVNRCCYWDHRDPKWGHELHTVWYE